MERLGDNLPTRRMEGNQNEKDQEEDEEEDVETKWGPMPEEK